LRVIKKKRKKTWTDSMSVPDTRRKQAVPGFGFRVQSLGFRGVECRV